MTQDICPLKLRVAASLVGGIVGILNHTLIFVIPSIPAVFLMYPWLYRKLREALQKDIKPRYFGFGLQFSFYVAVIAAFFIATALFFSSLFDGQAPSSWIDYPIGFLYMVFTFELMACMLMPILFIIGYLYIFANYVIIKKYYHPNADTPS